MANERITEGLVTERLRLLGYFDDPETTVAPQISPIEAVTLLLFGQQAEPVVFGDVTNDSVALIGKPRKQHWS
jgi:hypothetical protein